MFPSQVAWWPDLPQAALAALWRGEKIEAIKVVRSEQDIELKEAKDAVDAYLRTQPELQKRIAAAQAERNQGCLRWFALLLVLVALATYWYWTRGT